MEIKVGQEPTQERAGGSVRRAKVLAILATEEKSTVNAGRRKIFQCHVGHHVNNAILAIIDAPSTPSRR